MAGLGFLGLPLFWLVAEITAGGRVEASGVLFVVLVVVLVFVFIFAAGIGAFAFAFAFGFGAGRFAGGFRGA